MHLSETAHALEHRLETDLKEFEEDHAIAGKLTHLAGNAAHLAGELVDDGRIVANLAGGKSARSAVRKGKGSALGAAQGGLLPWEVAAAAVQNASEHRRLTLYVVAERGKGCDAHSAQVKST